MAHTFFSNLTIVPAVVPTAGAATTITATVVNGTGFDRACFIIATGAAAAGATLDAKVQESASSGGSYTDHGTATDITQLLAASGASKVVAIDLKINPDMPFMKIVGAVGTDTFANGAVCVLYKGSGSLPRTAAASFKEAIVVH